MSLPSRWRAIVETYTADWTCSAGRALKFSASGDDLGVYRGTIVHLCGPRAGPTLALGRLGRLGQQG